MAKRYTIELPGTHPTINQWSRMHFMARLNLNNQWKKTVWGAAKAAKIPMIKNPVEIEIEYHHKYKSTDKRRLDIDNFVPKFICDGLVGVVILDDSIDYVKKLTWSVIKDGEDRSIIFIKELS